MTFKQNSPRGELDSWYEGDVPPNILGEGEYLLILGDSLLNFPEITFHYTLNVQYESKLATKQFAELKR